MLNKPNNIPISPGIYFFLDSSKKPIYIGKALNLKKRLASYFQKNHPDSRIADMVNDAAYLKWQTTDSEIEALILESVFIKNKKPKYNILMRDDKRYSYVGFTKEIWPKIFVTHAPLQVINNKPRVVNNKLIAYSLKLTTYIGPFTDSVALRSTLKILRKTFPYCTCEKTHNRKCLNAHIGLCFGDCCLNTIKNQKLKIKNSTSYKLKAISYRKNIKTIRDILSGKRIILVRQLKRELSTSIKKQNFEKAIELRNQINLLERIFSNAQIINTMTDRNEALGELKKIFELSDIPYRIESYDISNIGGQNATGSMVVFENGNPNKSQYRIFNIRSKNSPDDTAMLKEVLMRRFNHSEWSKPNLILIDGGKAQLNAAIQAISHKLSALSSTPIISLSKGKDRKGKEIFTTTRSKPVSFKSLSLKTQSLIKYIDSEAHRFAINQYRKLHRKKVF